MLGRMAPSRPARCDRRVCGALSRARRPRPRARCVDRRRRHEGCYRRRARALRTVGADLVNHCVNDILVCNAIAALLFGLSRGRKARPCGGCRDRERVLASLPQSRLRAAWRRNRRDAGALSRRRISIWRGRSSASWRSTRSRSWVASSRATRLSACRLLGCIPTATRSHAR